MEYKTEQEAFWAGAFGDDYIHRNQGDALLAANLNLFSKALRTTREVRSYIEFGANVGMNLKALRMLLPDAEAHAIEINEQAARTLRDVIPSENVHNQSIIGFEPRRNWDLAFIKGVLIHINPDELPAIYEVLVKSCARYLLVAEYYNPVPTSIPYRGHADRLFKRDFAGEILERHPRMKLLDYGFIYRRDPNFPQDDTTWFLMEKTPS